MTELDPKLKNYKQIHYSVTDTVNVKVLADSGAAAVSVALAGLLFGVGLSKSLALGLIGGLAGLIAAYYKRPIPEDGVITKYIPEIPEDLELEDGLHGTGGFPVAEDY